MRLADFAQPEGTEQWALWLASQGMHVVPVHWEGKAPLLRHWQEQATTDPAQIAEWFGGEPRNIGIACGKSNLLVVDEDALNGLVKYANDHEVTIPDTFTVRTREGRKHYYFRSPGGLTNKPGELKEYGCDVRGKGGLVVGPGSKHETGSVYTLESMTTPVADMPAWLAVVLTREPKKQAPGPSTDDPVRGSSWALSALEAECSALAALGEGQHRNEALNTAAFKLGQLVPHLLDRADAERALWQASQANGYIDKDGEHEARGTLRSGLDDGMLAPRQGPIEDTRQEPIGGEAWDPVDLSKWFADPPEPPERFGSGRLLYRGLLHWVAGPPESGKTTVCLNWAVEEMRRGNSVLILDEEMGRNATFSKLVALGATEQQMRDRLVYLEPMGRNLVADFALLKALVNKHDIQFVMLDSAQGHLANAGLNENDAGDVSKFIGQVLLPLTKQMNATVLVVDHVGKNPTNRLSPRGSEAKRGLTDIGFNVDMPTSSVFKKGRDGALYVECTKDRGGDYGRGAKWRVDVFAQDGLSLCFTEFTDEIPAAVRADVERWQDAKTKTQQRRLFVLGMVETALMPITASQIWDQTPASLQAGWTRDKVTELLRSLVNGGLAVQSRIEGSNTNAYQATINPTNPPDQPTRPT